MDEILFRSSQKIENLQVQLGVVSSQTKQSLQQYSEQMKDFLVQAWNSSQGVVVRQNVQEIWQVFISKSQEFQYKFSYYANLVSPKKLYLNLVSVLSKQWTRRDVYFLCVGFVCGGIVGITIGLVIKKKEPILRYMQAIQCTNYLGIESASVIENAVAPHECGPDDVLINVKAASVQVIDAKICNGYGRILRRILQKMYNQSRSDIPVTLGRDCTGIITDIGPAVKRLEVGDEVWLSVPFWHKGTLSQSFLVSEHRVGRKPKTIGFEGACSLPYAGSIAFSTLQHVGVTSENAKKKRVFVHGGCTPVGCVLVQILTHWGAEVTASCYKRAMPVAKALGAEEVIVLPEKDPDSPDNKSTLNAETVDHVPKILPKELELRDRFDVIIITRECSLTKEQLSTYCKGGSNSIIFTTPPDLASDRFGIVTSFFYEGYIRFKHVLEKVFSLSMNEYDEAHMCYVLLDEMSDMVENGNLQTVVDKVYHPQDIEIALAHIQTPQSIGSTVITFR